MYNVLYNLDMKFLQIRNHDSYTRTAGDMAKVGLKISETYKSKHLSRLMLGEHLGRSGSWCEKEVAS